MKIKSAASLHQVFEAQTGMVLLLCLLFLTTLTLLGLSASAETVMQDQLATNLQETDHARQSALTAQKWAENWLLELEGPAPDSCSAPCDGLFVHTAGSLPSHPEFENLSWWMAQGHEAGVDPMTGERIAAISVGSAHSPLWIIEAIHEIPPTGSGNADLQTWYRVLTRGSGRTDAGVSVIESIIVRSWASAHTPHTGASVNCPGTQPGAKCGRVAWRELR